MRLAIESFSRVSRIAAAFLALSAGISAAHAQYYSVAAVTSIPGGIGLAQGLNNNGDAVGYESASNGSNNLGFLYSGGVTVTLGSLGGNNSYAFGINDAGVDVYKRQNTIWWGNGPNDNTLVTELGPNGRVDVPVSMDMSITTSPLAIAINPLTDMILSLIHI